MVTWFDVVPYFIIIISVFMVFYEIKMKNGKNWGWFFLFWLAILIWAIQMVI